MLQTLLEGRIKLAVHLETKEDSREAKEFRPGDGSLEIRRGLISGQKAPLPMLVKQLSTVLARNVTDETGLNGEFDFKLEWTPDDTPPDLASGPSLFTAIQEQLGLKLEARKEQVEILVIDHVERPDPN